MPVIEEVADEFRDEGVVLYAVNSAERPNSVQRYVQETGFSGTVALDLDGAVSIAYQAEMLPMTVLIDTQGRVQKVYMGVAPGIETEIRRDLGQLLSGKDLVRFQTSE